MELGSTAVIVGAARCSGAQRLCIAWYPHNRRMHLSERVPMSDDDAVRPCSGTSFPENRGVVPEMDQCIHSG